MGREVRLVDIVKLEVQAQRSGTLEDSMQVWTINFYGQRAFWYDIFVGLTDVFEILFCQFILETFPAPSFSDEYFELRGYLRHSAGIPPPPQAYAILLPSMKKRESCSILQKLRLGSRSSILLIAAFHHRLKISLLHSAIQMVN